MGTTNLSAVGVYVMSEGRSDKDLVAQCLDGDRGAFEHLVARYERQVFNAAFRLLNNVEEARDVAQGVFLKAWESLDRFDARYQFFSWLYRITINEAINANRRRHRYDELHEEQTRSGDPGPEVSFEGSELGRHLQRALMELKLEYRMVIVLRHWLDCSYAEMAEITQVPEKTVKSRLFSARRLLRENLAQRGVVR